MGKQKIDRKKENKGLAFQRSLVEKLNSGKADAYADASIYTVMLDLVEGNDMESVFGMLHNAATDLGRREELEALTDKAKGWKWPVLK